MKKLISRVIVAGALTASLGLGASTAWAADYSDTAETPEVSSHYLTKSQIEQFSLDALNVGDPQPAPGTVRAYGYLPGGMNAEEMKFCALPWNWGKCATAKQAADDALARAQQKFDSATLYQGKGDAYRHCYWSARMTIDMGASVAKGFGDRHEAESSGADKDMDLANNATGRSVASSYRTYDSASNRCETLAKTGKLVTLK